MKKIAVLAFLALNLLLTKNICLAQGDVISFSYENPVGESSLTRISEVFLSRLQSIIGWLAIIALAIGAFVYLTSAGNSTRLSLAKNIITSALIGFVIVIGAPSILVELKDITSSEETPANIIDTAPDAKNILTKIMNFLLTTFGVLALISFAISGIIYLSATGDPKKQETAKKIFLYSIIAIAVATSGIIILRQVQTILLTK